jgi:hypothetical protein
MKLNRLYVGAALIAVSLAVTSCSEGSPTAPEATAPVAQEQPFTDAELLGLLQPTLSKVGLMTCSPLQAAYASARIGPNGGALRVGPHTLVVPAGALDRTVTITAYAPRSQYNRVEFTPHGLEFDRPAYLTMSYANCDLLARLVPKRIAYVNDRLTILYLLESVDNIFTKKVTGRVDHFSEYAIAW